MTRDDGAVVTGSNVLLFSSNSKCLSMCFKLHVFIFAYDITRMGILRPVGYSMAVNVIYVQKEQFACPN